MDLLYESKRMLYDIKLMDDGKETELNKLPPIGEVKAETVVIEETDQLKDIDVFMDRKETIKTNMTTLINKKYPPETQSELNKEAIDTLNNGLNMEEEHFRRKTERISSFAK